MIGDIKGSVGLDLHKKFILATVLWQTGQMQQERFDRTKEGLYTLKAWATGHHADVVACESTSDYWVQIYDLLNGIIPVIVGNAVGEGACFSGLQAISTTLRCSLSPQESSGALGER
jgi:hypothetical protein